MHRCTKVLFLHLANWQARTYVCLLHAVHPDCLYNNHAWCHCGQTVALHVLPGRIVLLKADASELHFADDAR